MTTRFTVFSTISAYRPHLPSACEIGQVFFLPESVEEVSESQRG